MSKMATTAMKVRSYLLGSEHEDNLNSAGIVGLTSFLEWKRDQAEEIWPNLRKFVKECSGKIIIAP